MIGVKGMVMQVWFIVADLSGIIMSDLLPDRE